MCEHSKWHRLHRLRERVALRPGIDHGDPVEPEIFEGDAYRRREPWGIGTLAFHAEQAVPPSQQQVDLGALVRAPEPGLVERLGCEDLLDYEAFPGGAELGVGQQRFLALEPQELVP